VDQKQVLLPYIAREEALTGRLKSWQTVRSLEGDENKKWTSLRERRVWQLPQTRLTEKGSIPQKPRSG